MTDGSWGDYVFEAGTDPEALETTSDALGTVADATTETIEWADTSGLEQPAVDALAAAESDSREASAWQSFVESDLSGAASWERAAEDRIGNAMEWLEYGNVDAAQQEFSAAGTAYDIAQQDYASASTDLGIAAEYMDSSAAGVDTAASYDASASYDSGSADASADASA